MKTLSQLLLTWFSSRKPKPEPPMNLAMAYFTSEEGLRFIAKWEGYKKYVYDDVAGYKTIGYGHLVTKAELSSGRLATGENWRKGLSRQAAFELLRRDVANAEQAVKDLITVPLTQRQFDVLVSFTFNLGRGNLSKSTLRRKLNRGNYRCVPKELKKWRKAGGKVITGLVNRRKAEGENWSA